MAKRRRDAGSVRLKNGCALDGAMAAVREGRAPHLDDNDDFGTRVIEDPFEIKRADGTRARSVKIVALRDDPIGRMHKRGQLRRESDRDDNDPDIRLAAARRWQSLYEQAEIGGARAIDFTRDVVSGGVLKLPDSDSLHMAQQQLLEFDCALGSKGAHLVRAVLGERLELKDVALRIRAQTDYERRYLGHRLIECLDTLANEMGLKASRPARGPRRERDEWDKLAPFADQPRLIEAMRRAKR